MKTSRIILLLYESFGYSLNSVLPKDDLIVFNNKRKIPDKIKIDIPLINLPEINPKYKEQDYLSFKIRYINPKYRVGMNQRKIRKRKRL